MRNVSADIFMDEFIGSLPLIRRLLWIGLIVSCADDQGRMTDNPAWIRSRIFPYDEIPLADIEAGLDTMAAAHKILRYTVSVNGSNPTKLIQISAWWKYQAGARWATRSKLPAPEKWIDRIRCHEKGNRLVTENWNQPGGLCNGLYSKLHSGLNSREEEDDKESEKKIMTPTAAEGEGVGEGTNAVAAAADCTMLEMLKKYGVPVRYQAIAANPKINPAIWLSALAQAYASGARKPVILAADNLLNNEPVMEIYSDEREWRRQIPANILAIGRPDLAEKHGDDFAESVKGYTQVPEIQTPSPLLADPEMAKAWDGLMGALQKEMDKALFQSWVMGIQPIKIDGNKLTIQVSNSYSRQWLEERLTKTVENLLVGIMNKKMSVEFVCMVESHQ